MKLEHFTSKKAIVTPVLILHPFAPVGNACLLQDKDEACHSMHIFLRESPIEHSGAYF